MSASSPGATPESVNPAAQAPQGPASVAELGAEHIAAAGGEGRSTLRLSRGYLTALVLAYCALYLAWIAPIGFSLAVRVGQIDPTGRNGALALAIGIPGVVVLLTGPLVGVLSDRTRSKLGRRRVWLLAGTLVGFLGSVGVGLSGSVALLVLTWTVAYIGYTAVGGMVLTHLGDRLPEVQRGRVAGFTGAVTQLAPVLGIVIAGSFTAAPFLLFTVPAAVALIGGLVFVAVMKDEIAPATMPGVDIRGLLAGFYFNPRRHTDFAWVWLSRALIFLGLSFTSIYTVYLLSARLGLPASALAGIVAASGLGGVLLGILGAILGGLLSDRLKRRRPFLVIAAVLMSVGFVITATTTSIPQFLTGSLIGVLGIGVYGAVDQAIMLDVLPKEEGQNGRFLGLFNLANQLAQAVGPFLAGLIVALGAGEYAWVYIAAAVLALAGGLSILPVRVARSLRAHGQPIAV